MKSFICVLAVGFLFVAEASAQDIAKERRPRTGADLISPPITYIDADGRFRIFTSMEECDRVLAREAKERKTDEKTERRFEGIERYQSRASEGGRALWTLAGGLLLGILGAIFGRK